MSQVRLEAPDAQPNLDETSATVVEVPLPGRTHHHCFFSAVSHFSLGRYSWNIHSALVIGVNPWGLLGLCRCEEPRQAHHLLASRLQVSSLFEGLSPDAEIFSGFNLSSHAVLASWGVLLIAGLVACWNSCGCLNGGLCSGTSLRALGTLKPDTSDRLQASVNWLGSVTRELST